jgi:hypothetical protein
MNIAATKALATKLDSVQKQLSALKQKRAR